jgi:hypothetical protein
MTEELKVEGFTKLTFEEFSKYRNLPVFIRTNTLERLQFDNNSTTLTDIYGSTYKIKDKKEKIEKELKIRKSAPNSKKRFIVEGKLNPKKKRVNRTMEMDKKEKRLNKKKKGK